MAYEIPDLSITLTAAAALTQFTGVVVDANGQAAVPAAGAAIDGVVQNAPGAGQAAQIMVDGVSKMVAGGAVGAGALVCVDNQGRAVAGATGNAYVGRALAAAAAAGEIIPVLLGYRGTHA